MGEAIIRHIEDHAAAASQARALWLQFEVNIEAQLVIPPGVEWFIFNV